MSKYNFNSETIQDIITRYVEKNESMSKISKLFYVSTSVIKRILVENDISIKDNNAYKSKKVNISYFDNINSEEKAYILGFIYADGYITKTTMGIKLHSRDREILEKIKGCLQSDHKIIDSIGHNGFNANKPNHYSMLSINNKELVESLKRCGLIYNKSKVIEFPKCIPNNLIQHFIRGYFDGNGSVCMAGGIVSVSFCGSKDIMENILKELKKYIDTKSNVHKHKSIFEIKIGGNKLAKQIYNYLYENSTIFLKRKYDKFTSLVA